ncbi:hypothetical protein [Eubacterium ventriosum]|uniref:hypothetical protein n=1 Tax=Eubacterium ventriosum TaxID=39496 RepID=UPI00266E9354|nr:hypothetical protein [Eubacterium ventriosum]
MKKELTNTDIFVLEEKVYDIENVLSMVKIIENALICEGSLIVQSDIKNALNMIENEIEESLTEIYKTLNLERI